ncbi:MAG: nucleotidyl transferase AbiEii/AbiGii toxin family protein [Myxococcota bacterium]
MEHGTDAGLRHRLLEGFLLRLAREPDADAFVLRGGLRVRQLARRTARDADLVCRLPYDVPDVRARLERTLSRDAGDGAWFDAATLHLAPVWVGHPALRLHAAGAADGAPGPIAVDLVFGMPLWPPPEPATLRAERGAATLWMSRPEALIGRKLQVIASRGRLRWRPKDLADIDALLPHADPRALGPAVEAAFDGAERVSEVRHAFVRPSWWAPGRARWRAATPLDAVVARVGRALAPVLS